MLCPPRVRREPSAPALDTYLREINEPPLLTAGQEQDLARRVAAGDSAARDLLVRANLRLAVSVARRYAGRGVPLEDLIAEGNLGLIRAAELFDPGRGTRFSTYAVPWVTQAVRHHLAAAARPVRLPYYLTVLLARWGRAAARLQAEQGRPPAEAEVAAALGLSRRALEHSRAALRACGPPSAADCPDVAALPDHRAEAPGAALVAAEEVGKAMALLGRLEARQAAVLRLRFGLGGGGPKGLREVGRALGVTAETARRLERKALAALARALGGR